MNESFVDVSGMTCGHCERAVNDELGAVAGVHEVVADAGTGSVRVMHEGDLNMSAIHAAISRAGYTVVVPTPNDQ